MKLFEGIAALAAGLALLFGSKPANASVTIFSNSDNFKSSLSLSVTDTFGAELGYPAGMNNPSLRFLTDTEMSAVFGQTRFIGTGWGYPGQHSIMGHPFSPMDNKYSPVASVFLDFTRTTIGTQEGVSAVGFEVSANVAQDGDGPNYAYVTFLGGRTAAYALPVHNPNPHPPLYQISRNYGYWGITSTNPISSIHIGKIDGSPMSVNGSFVILDDLTIGMNAAVPEPATWTMFILGFGAVGGAMRSAKRRQKVTVSYA